MKNLDKAIEAAIHASDIAGVPVDWVVCVATRIVTGENPDNDENVVGYLTDSTRSTPDYRVLGLLEYVRDIIRSDISNGPIKEAE